MKFDPSNPNITDYILSNQSFSLEQVFGVNGKRRELSDEIIEAQFASRVNTLRHYLNNVPLNHDEVAKALNQSNELDDIQKGWARKAFGQIIQESELSSDLKNMLSIELIPIRDGVDISKKQIDMSLVKEDPLLSYSMDFKKDCVDVRIAEIVASELLIIANIDNKKIQEQKIKALNEATNTQSLSEVVTYLDAATNDAKIESRENAPVQKIRNTLTAIGTSLDKQIGEPVELNVDPSLSSIDGTTIDAAAYGQISVGEKKQNLTYSTGVDLALVTKQIIESQKIGVHTENVRASWLRNKANSYKEKVGDSLQSEKDTLKKDNGLASKIFNKIKGKTDDEPPISWESTDYDWSDRSEHFSQTNKAKISSVTFTDKSDEHIFTHKPNSTFGGGTILFAKGRLISEMDAKLMVAQFLKTNDSGSMHITPPKHLGSSDNTKQHIKRLMMSAEELGLPLESISVSPNKLISAADISDIREEILLNVRRNEVNELGGLSSSFVGDSIELTNENDLKADSVLETSNTNSTENEVVLEVDRENKQTPKP